MKPPSIFAVPVPTPSNLQQPYRSTVRKRKRPGQDLQPASLQTQEDSQIFDLDYGQNPEYTAVVTPAERSQRRLAGLSIDQEPPPFPFPHAGFTPKKSQSEDDQAAPEEHPKISKQSLHSQHLAAMTAVLHRSMMSQDYARAGRALGLILRNEVGGQTIDIRSEGLWGVGAEILLRRASGAGTGNTSSKSEHGTISAQGLEQAKLYYERLIVQYPRHKTWPDNVNALDFCIAMFGLWIYVVNEESLHLQMEVASSDSEDSQSNNPDSSMLEGKQWALEQAKQIAEAMDFRLRGAPFNDDPELIRLRAMVALWTANLIERCVELERDHQAQLDYLEQRQQEEQDLSDRVERMVIDHGRTALPTLTTDKAVDHRNAAAALFAKLKKINGRGASTDTA